MSLQFSPWRVKTVAVRVAPAVLLVVSTVDIFVRRSVAIPSIMHTFMYS